MRVVRDERQLRRTFAAEAQDVRVSPGMPYPVSYAGTIALEHDSHGAQPRHSKLRVEALREALVQKGASEFVSEGDRIRFRVKWWVSNGPLWMIDKGELSLVRQRGTYSVCHLVLAFSRAVDDRSHLGIRCCERAVRVAWQDNRSDRRVSVARDSWLLLCRVAGFTFRTPVLHLPQARQ